MRHVKRSVVLLGYQGVQALDLVGPFEVFSTATLILASQGRYEDGYEIIIASPDGSPASTWNGLQIVAQPLPHHRVDTVLVPGGAGIEDLRRNPDVLDWLRRAAKTARRVVSV